MHPQSTKFCHACKRDLPVAAFWKNKARKDGLQTYCKECFAPTSRQTAERFRQEHPDRSRAHRRAYYSRNSEKVRLWIKGWRQRNPDKTKEYNQRNPPRWYAANRTRARDTSRLYIERNRTKARIWWKELQSRRRARKMETQSGPVDYAAIYHRDHGICHICHNPVPKSRLHYDHVIPLSKGGTHTEANIKVSHARCNLKKGAKI